MGTHPIFESDFDCLTEMAEEKEVFGTDYPALRKHIAAYGRHSLSQDPRFINTNRQRQCWINYSEFYRCLYVREYLGKDTEVCGYFRNNFLQACPPQQIATYDEQRENNIFPSNVYSRDVADSQVWEPKHEAWKIQAEAAKAREAEYREFFQSQK